MAREIGSCSPLSLAAALEVGWSNLLGLAGAPEVAAQGRFGTHVYSKWPFDAGRPPWGTRIGRSSLLGSSLGLGVLGRQLLSDKTRKSNAKILLC